MIYDSLSLKGKLKGFVYQLNNIKQKKPQIPLLATKLTFECVDQNKSHISR